jgi:16S rRNA (guanine527-N7)-methyltransferase
MTPDGARELFAINGLPLDEKKIGKLLEYERLLLGWNEKINLVSRRDTSDVFTKQIVGSVAFLFSYRLAGGSTLLDVGTGGGLPGIPLAVIYPDVTVTMIDSIQKKMKAVTDIVANLGLPNARVLCGRVEELGTGGAGKPGGSGEPGGFDYVVARGVSSASEIVVWCRRLLRKSRPAGSIDTTANTGPRKLIPAGSYILLKGGDLTDELTSLSEVADPATVTVRSLGIEGVADQFTDKKVIVITP